MLRFHVSRFTELYQIFDFRGDMRFLIPFFFLIRDLISGIEEMNVGDYSRKGKVVYVFFLFYKCLLTRLFENFISLFLSLSICLSLKEITF